MEKSKSDIKKIILVAFIIILLYFGVNNLSVVVGGIKKIFSMLFPFVLGGALAFILNLPMTFFENIISKIKEKICNKSKNKKKSSENKSKIVRIIAILFAIVVIAIILTIILNLIVPELVNIFNLLIDNIPYYT